MRDVQGSGQALIFAKLNPSEADALRRLLALVPTLSYHAEAMPMQRDDRLDEPYNDRLD